MRVKPRVGSKANGDDPNTHGWAVNRETPHTAIEDRWIAAQRESFEAAAPTIAWAVVKALEESGLTKATLGVDDERIATMLRRIGLTGARFVPGANLFRRIRVIKSPVEIALMRIAGENNSVATERVIQGLQKGMTAEDIEQSFAVEAAKLGSTKVSFLPGMAIAGFPTEVFVVAAIVDLLYQYWIHTEQVGKLGWFDRWFASPSNHRVDHAVNDRYLDRNYGGILVVWDRMFGSFAEEDDAEPCV
jgi:hypothetical protein